MSFPATTNTHNSLAAATVNNTLVQTGGARLLSLELSNFAAYAVYYKIFDKATAPVAGTDHPVATIAVPANSSVSRSWPAGFLLANGYGFAMTKLQVDSDTTVLVAGDLRVKGDYA